jgi:hypothetical protein
MWKFPMELFYGKYLEIHNKLQVYVESFKKKNPFLC